MNNKGFTLVELLAVLIILGIVVGITVVSINTNLSSTKSKSEEVFVKTIKDSLDMYLDSDNAKNLAFSDDSCATITKAHGDAKLYKAKAPISFRNVFASYNSLTEDEFVNPNNKDEKCDVDAKIISIYRDSDYVYYYCINKDNIKIKEKDINCLKNSGYISTLPEGVECS